MADLEKLCLKLQEIGAVKFGEFKIKDGSISPIYIDLRILVSFPEVLEEVAFEIGELALPLKFDRVCGLPYAALPIGTAVSLKIRKPMIYPRREVKDYGTKKQVEGLYNAGEKILIIDDLVTSGLSKFEFIDIIEKQNLKVTDVVVLIDREQGAGSIMKEKGYNLHAVLKMSYLLDVLLLNKKITQQQFDQVKAYLVKSK